MFGTIRRHQQWLWVVIIFFTIISFVWFFNPSSNTGSSSRKGPIVCIVGGRPVPQPEYATAVHEVGLEFLCNYGYLPDDAEAKQMGFNPQQRAYLRIAMLEKANELHLEVGDEAAQRLAGNIVASFGRNGVHSYQEFVKGVLTPHNYTGAEFAQFTRHQLAIQQLMSLQGIGSYLIPPQEAEEIYRRENQKLETEIVLFQASNYLAGVQVTPEAVSAFFTNQLANYRIGERAVLDYVFFPSSNHLADADVEIGKMTNLTELVNAEYLRRGTNGFPAGATPEECKAQIKEELRNQLALVSTRRAANQFATLVYNQASNHLAEMKQLAASSNLTVETTAPFPVTGGPREFDTSDNFSRLLAGLTPEQPVSPSPAITTNGIYVFALAKRIPSEVPSFDSVKLRVTEDFKEHEALQAAQQAGTMAASSIHEALTAGKDFKEACTAAGVTPVKLPPFSLSVRSDPDIEKYINLGVLQNTVFTMTPGETSPFRAMSQGGYILHYDRALPIDPEEMKKDMPHFITQMRMSRQNELLNGWFRRLQQTGYLELPRNENRSESSSTNSAAS